MPTYYVGPGGKDTNNGTTWALRKLTLNGAEDIPVAANDTVYVGPGTYRELLTCDVSGTAGNVISYIGDYTGASTDGVGGVVRITGSAADTTYNRPSVIVANDKDYRTFRGFQLDMGQDYGINATGGCTNWTVDQCIFPAGGTAGGMICISCIGDDQASWVVSNCHFNSGRRGIYFDRTAAGAGTANAGHVVSNCVSLMGRYGHVECSYIGGVTVRNCLLWGYTTGVLAANLPGGYTAVTVNNCAIVGCAVGLNAGAAGMLVENYNAIYACNTARTNVSIGAQSNAYPFLPDTRWFFELVGGGDMLSPFDMASYCQLVNVAGTSPTATDMRGTGTIGAAREWGPLEYDPTLLVAGGAGGGPSVGGRRVRGIV